MKPVCPSITEVQIIDTHLHIWDPKRLRYPWLTEVPQIAEEHLVEHYHADCGRIPVKSMVFVQCECARDQFMEELAWVTEIARIDPRIEAIVSWAPLEKADDVRAALDRIVEQPLVRGIRRIIQHEPDPLEFSQRPSFIRGVQILAEYDLSFDICINHRELDNAIHLVRQCPDVNFVLDHIGKPDIRRQVLDPWREQIRILSRLPNIWCKVSGLVTEANLDHWTPLDLKPYLDHVVECFGFDRLMFGGDWPVVVLAGSYRRWFEALSQWLESYSTTDRRKLLHDTGEQFYRLGTRKGSNL